MGSIPIISVMLEYHMYEFKFRWVYYMLSFVLCSLLVWEFKYSVLFVLCPINLMFTELYEGFSCFLWLSICSSLIINLPLLTYSFLHFIVPGLFSEESKRWVFLSKLFVSLFLILISIYMIYLLPFLVSFFIGFMSSNLICSIISLCAKVLTLPLTHSLILSNTLPRFACVCLTFPMACCIFLRSSSSAKPGKTSENY